MSKEYSETGANIRNYNELGKGSISGDGSLWISPKFSAYGLPALQITPLPLKRSLVGSDTAVKKLQSNPASQSDRNFLLGTAVAAILLFLSVLIFHNWTNQNTDLAEIPSETLDFDHQRVNQSPESILISENISPELIPGVFKEQEVANCALIVGSFSRKSNAIEMQQAVISAGYELYTEEYHEFYRVGVSIPCSDIKGATFTEIENSLGIDPWLRISF